MVSKLLSYATGRHMGIVDQFEIDEILERVRSENFGLETLLVEAVTSEIFGSR